jgi:hypothetical protein
MHLLSDNNMAFDPLLPVNVGHLGFAPAFLMLSLSDNFGHEKHPHGP